MTIKESIARRISPVAFRASHIKPGSNRSWGAKRAGAARKAGIILSFLEDRGLLVKEIPHYGAVT